MRGVAIAWVLWGLALGACKSGDKAPANKTQASQASAGSGSAGSAAPEPGTGTGTGAGLRRDPHSQSRPDEVAIEHLALELAVDFTTKVMTGTATLTLDRRVKTASEVVLDTVDLTITGVTDCKTKQALDYRLGDEVKRLGRALTVKLYTDCIVVAYRTAPTAKALLWVEPAGTAGKTKPMLFTQSQAIHARSWIPLQDSPGVRFTYEAKITTPPGLRPVMSAENPLVSVDGVWRFHMPQKIPSYLMALAVGDFVFRDIGSRTGVWTEPSVADAAAAEFAEVEQMVTVGEKLYGPYRWGRYDILVLPPSFPFGGMENPRLTFLTPTVIVGDKSLVSLIAHELAHSWSGNLVTNSTWNDLWLNEGFTTYVEQRIMEELRGKDVADLGWFEIRKDLDETLASGDGLDTRLALDYGPEGDPEDKAPSDVAYFKGALLLRAMELEFGREAFDAFLRERFDRLAFQSTDSKTFEADANAKLFATKRVGWTLAQWLYENGLPQSAPPTTSSRADALAAAATAFAKDGALPDTASWKTTEWTVFLRSIPRDVSPRHLAALDAKHGLTRSNNAVLAMRWLPLLVAADQRTAAPAVEAYLVRVGRRWLVSEVYKVLQAKNDYWRGVAKRAFDKAKAGYHPITRDSIAEMLAKPANRTP